jgi:D-3-phosphoglycerate dehydrogenase
MRIIASDPFVSRELAKDRGVEMVEFDDLLAQSDYISLHTSLNPQTRHLLNRESFKRMKGGVRIVNCARGELIDPEALNEALKAGKVAGAALGVFSPEPPAGSPLLEHDNVIATPHIGGSTEEAQESVGIRIAEQVRDFLRDGVVMSAVNMPSVTAEQYGHLRPQLDLAERLASFVAQIVTAPPRRVRIVYSGAIGQLNTSLVRNAALAGILNRFLSQKANLINAAQVAAERGLEVSETRQTRAHAQDTLSIALETDEGASAAEGAVFAGLAPRLINVDGIYIEGPLTGHMVFLKNRDVPGVIGRIGTILGEGQINIADFSLGRRENHKGPGEPAEAIAVVRIDEPLPPEILKQLEVLPPVQFARAVELPA